MCRVTRVKRWLLPYRTKVNKIRAHIIWLSKRIIRSTFILDLRKQARQLENEIDLKLVAFSKLGAGIKTPQSGHSDTVPLLSGEDTFEAMSVEIEQLLSKVFTILIYIGFRIFF